MPRHAGIHRFDGLKIGQQSLQDTLDGYELQIDALISSADGYALGVSTDEAFTLTVDAVNGIDPTVPTVIKNQSRATAYGSFKTMSGAISTLPENLYHNITISLLDGTHSISDFRMLGNVSRFNFGWNAGITGGQLIIKSANGLTTVSGTSSMSVASISSNREFTLTVDPGFADDAYAGYFVKVISGSGSGQIKAIRRHSGADFRVAGRFSPGLSGTSVVQIVEAAALIDLTPVGGFGVVQLDSPNLWSGFENIIFDAVDMIATSGGFIIFRGAAVRLRGGCRFLGIQIDAGVSGITLDNTVIDGNGVAFAAQGPALLLCFGGWVASGNSNSSWLIRNSTTLGGIHLETSVGLTTYASRGFVFKGAIDDCVDGITIAGKNADVFTETQLEGIGNTGHGVVLKENAQYLPNLSDILVESEYLTGNSGDIKIDGDTVSYTEVSQQEDKSVLGKYNSIIIDSVQT